MKGRQEQGDDGGISPPEGHLPPASPSSKAPSAPISFLSLPLENDSLEEPIAKKKKAHYRQARRDMDSPRHES